MTLDELTEDCWRDLPAIRKHLAGRDAVKRVLADALVELDVAELDACRSNADLDGYERRLLNRVERRRMADDKDGFVILTFVLMAVAGAVISWLVQRWLDNHFDDRKEIEQLKAVLA